MSANVWIVLEQWRGRLSEVSFEVLALARTVADALGTELDAVLLGDSVRDLAKEAGVADRVLYVGDPSLAEPSGLAVAEALATLALERQPRAIILPLTNVTLGIGTLLSVRLGVPAVNFCTDLEVVGGGALQARCFLYAGKMECVVQADAVPAVVGVWPGSRPADAGRSDRVPLVENVAFQPAAAAPVRLRKYIEPEAGDVDLTKQDVLVAVGRGMQDGANLSLADDLAREFGAAVCGSRPVVDQGWLPLSRQVGKSGCTVKPKLYIALGISGAPEHVEGIRGSGVIVAVNTDPRAPIFDIAHYGVVADVLEFVPALTDGVRAAKAKAAHA